MIRIPLLTLGVLSLAATALARQPPANPAPVEILPSPLGVTLEPWVRIPNSPINNRPPRLNHFRQLPDGRSFVIDQRGYLYVIPTGTTQPILYLDLFEKYPDIDWITPDASQTGFTYFAFHPEFADNGIFYTVVSVPFSTGTPDIPGKRPIPLPGGSRNDPTHHDVILRWAADDPAALSFSGSVSEILRIEQPYADHNVGEIAFNPLARPGHPDYGLLFIATGDGGSVFRQLPPDPQGNAQDLSSPLGKILRIDPEGTHGRNGRYGIPGNNPFLFAGNALPEIWAYGLRNPHRLSWDPFTGDLHTYDIGGESFEEINRVVRGGNYGWNKREGPFRNEGDVVFPLPENDADFGFLYPIAYYDHIGRNGAISGGHVYRGNELPGLHGHFLYADFTNRNEFFHSPAALVPLLENRETLPVYRLNVYNSNGLLLDLSRIIRSQANARTDVRLGVGDDGGIYLTNKHTGWIHRLAPPPQSPVLRLPPSPVVVPPEATSFSVEIAFEGEPGLWSVEWTDERLTLEGEPFGAGAATLVFQLPPKDTPAPRRLRLRINGEPLAVVHGEPVVSTSSWVYHPQNGWMWLDAAIFPWVFLAEFAEWFFLDE